jgi:pseudouridine synthase
MEERLQKIMARAGIASRRRAEEMIAAGKVSVNGVPVSELGSKADAERDEVRVEGRLISASRFEQVYLMLNKPEGYVTTTSDPEGRPTVMDLVKHAHQRIYPVGRLDFNTSGLLLFTSDGELTRFLTHPSSRVPKTYQVKVAGRIGPPAIEKLKKGPAIGGPALKPAEVEFLKVSRSGKNSWLKMTIHEGRTRQIRKMGEAVGHEVLKLKRVALGPLYLSDLPLGDFRYLTDKEVAGLKRLMAEPARAKPKKKRGAK